METFLLKFRCLLGVVCTNRQKRNTVDVMWIVPLVPKSLIDFSDNFSVPPKSSGSNLHMQKPVFAELSLLGSALCSLLCSEKGKILCLSFFVCACHIRSENSLVLLWSKNVLDWLNRNVCVFACVTAAMDKNSKHFWLFRWHSPHTPTHTIADKQAHNLPTHDKKLNRLKPHQGQQDQNSHDLHEMPIRTDKGKSHI